MYLLSLFVVRNYFSWSVCYDMFLLCCRFAGALKARRCSLTHYVYNPPPTHTIGSAFLSSVLFSLWCKSFSCASFSLTLGIALCHLVPSNIWMSGRFPLQSALLPLLDAKLNVFVFLTRPSSYGLGIPGRFLTWNVSQLLLKFTWMLSLPLLLGRRVQFLVGI